MAPAPAAGVIQAQELTRTQFHVVLQMRVNGGSEKKAMEFYAVMLSYYTFLIIDHSGRVASAPWRFYQLSNEGVYLAPDIEALRVKHERRGHEPGDTLVVSGDAAGVAACLFALELLGQTDPRLAEDSRRLRTFAEQHAEAEQIRAMTPPQNTCP